MKFDAIKNDFQDKFAVALDIDSAKTGFPFIFIKKHKISPSAWLLMHPIQLV
jgi:hypothetical protein